MTGLLVFIGNLIASPMVQKILIPAIGDIVLRWMESHRVRLETKAAFTAAELAKKSEEITNASQKIRAAMAR